MRGCGGAHAAISASPPAAAPHPIRNEAVPPLHPCTRPPPRRRGGGESGGVHKECPISCKTAASLHPPGMENTNPKPRRRLTRPVHPLPCKGTHPNRFDRGC